MRRVLWILAVLPHVAGACTLDAAVTDLQADALARAGRSRALIDPILGEIRSITAKEVEGREASRVSELGARMQAVAAAELIEAAHSRDAGFVQRMIGAARRSADDAEWQPSESEQPEFALFALRALFPHPEAELLRPPGSGCTVDMALRSEMLASQRRMEAFSAVIERDRPVLAELRARAGAAPGAPLDPAQLAPAEARMLARIMADTAPLFREATLNADLANIAGWWQAAGIIYDTRREDLRTWREAGSVGRTLAVRLSGLEPRIQVMVRLWTNLDERAPPRPAALVTSDRRSGAIALAGAP